MDNIDTSSTNINTKSNNKLFLIIFLVILVLIGGGVALGVILSRKKPTCNWKEFPEYTHMNPACPCPSSCEDVLWKSPEDPGEGVACSNGQCGCKNKAEFHWDKNAKSCMSK